MDELALSASARLTIDVEAIVRNYRTLKEIVGTAHCASVVKADAYGLGASIVAPRLERVGCRDFFVATLDEGMALRPILADCTQIYVLNGLPPGSEPLAKAARVIPVLNSLDQCRRWAAAGGGAAVLQVDTGMCRMGLSVREQDELRCDTALFGKLELVLLMSHLANADDPDHPSNAQQLSMFHQSRERFPDLPASLANSAGVFLGSEYHFDLCRPGAALYGLQATPIQASIEPVVTLEARVGQLRDIYPGDSVGYGYRFTAHSTMRIALVALGYADGWPRSLSERGAAWFGGHRLPIIGRISMDSLVVDVTALHRDALGEGDFVTLIGPHQTADHVAETAGTIGYEILTSLGRRYARAYKLTSESAS